MLLSSAALFKSLREEYFQENMNRCISSFLILCSQHSLWTQMFLKHFFFPKKSQFSYYGPRLQEVPRRLRSRIRMEKEKVNSFVVDIFICTYSGTLQEFPHTVLQHICFGTGGGMKMYLYRRHASCGCLHQEKKA